MTSGKSKRENERLREPLAELKALFQQAEALRLAIEEQKRKLAQERRRERQQRWLGEHPPE